jgi:hypothetical protein
MSRTRGASATLHDDDGVMLDKFGKPMGPSTGMPMPPLLERLDRAGNPISPAAAVLQPVRALSGNRVLQGPGAEPVPVMPAIVGYRADKASWSKNMEAHELAQLLDLAFRNPGDLGDGFVVNLTPEEYGKLGGDVRRHFMAVRRVAA